MSLALVIFDLGNTLVDYHRGGLSDDEKDLVGLHRMHIVLRKHYPALTFSALYEGFYRPWMKAQAYRSKKTREYDVREFLGRVFDIAKLSELQYRRAMLAFHGPYIETVWIAPGVCDLLRNLASMDISIALLANSPIPGFCHDAALERVGLLPFLKTRFFGYDVGMRKPDIRLFEMLISLAGVKPATTIMVGDSERLDLAPARRLGIRAVKFDCRAIRDPPDTSDLARQDTQLCASPDFRELVTEAIQDITGMTLRQMQYPALADG